MFTAVSPAVNPQSNDAAFHIQNINSIMLADSKDWTLIHSSLKKIIPFDFVDSAAAQSILKYLIFIFDSFAYVSKDRKNCNRPKKNCSKSNVYPFPD